MTKSKKGLKKKDIKGELIDVLFLSLFDTLVVFLGLYVIMGETSFLEGLLKFYEEGKLFNVLMVFLPVFLVCFGMLNLGYKALRGKI